MVTKKTLTFPKETDLCAAFIHSLPDEWVAYPETAGFDILVVRKKDGFQIGVEAKLKLNTKVILQAAENANGYSVGRTGPDCRAVLVPAYAGGGGGLAGICRLLGITVIRQEHGVDEINRRREKKSPWNGHCFFRPDLPLSRGNIGFEDWHEFAPDRRCQVPDYIPDVISGDKSPLMLTPWKVAAIKISITIEKRGYATRQDFKQHNINMSRWTQCRWIIPTGDMRWEKSKNMPDFRSQHPRNYVEIENDYETWKEKK